jgi:preprotein translocase subunit YajC
LGLNFLVVIVLLLGVMWVLIIRPQKRRQLQQQEILSSLAEGDEVLTAGGIYGTVRELDEDSLMLEIAPGTTIRVARRAVAGKVEPDEPEEDADEVDDDELEPADEAPEIDPAGSEESASVEPNRR